MDIRGFDPGLIVDVAIRVVVCLRSVDNRLDTFQLQCLQLVFRKRLHLFVEELSTAAHEKYALQVLKIPLEFASQRGSDALHVGHDIIEVQVFVHQINRAIGVEVGGRKGEIGRNETQAARPQGQPLTENQGF